VSALLRIAKWTPALVFATVAAFMVGRVLIALFPASEWSWWLYLHLAPFGREIGNLFPIGFAGGIAAVGVALAWSSAALWAATRVSATRLKFVTCHAALVLLLVALRDEGVFTASSDGVKGQTPISFLPDLANLDPLVGLLLAGVVIACAFAHTAVLREMRPVAGTR
jgi:hypothetical protein